MFNRRKFLQSSLLSSLGLVSGKKIRTNEILSPAILGKPVVVSTWDFGMAANAAAWNILERGGSSLDAVEAGVRVPEADPNNHTVGYAGMPDRDGRVTLDACIMNEKGGCGSVMCLEY
ncbi:MAG: isoaspartyl peptidase/L-asparaginase, partial [Chitinophagales bacterium]